jgi:hypothetical protein
MRETVRGNKAGLTLLRVVALSILLLTVSGTSNGKRLRLANDPLKLMAADGPAKQQKSDSLADARLPANKAFRCEHVVSRACAWGVSCAVRRGGPRRSSSRFCPGWSY